MNESIGAPEIKAHGTEMTAEHDRLMNLFETFREANDDRLGDLEKRMAADVVIEEKVDRLTKALDEQQRRMERLTLKSTRPQIGIEDRPAAALPSEHKQAFEAYARGGNETLMRQLEAKAMSQGTGADGGFLVPDETETEIGRRLIAISPVRSVATIRTVSGAVLKKPFAISGAQTGWVGETEVRPETAAPQLAELSFPTMELYAMPAATNALLDDAAVDLDRWIGEEVEQAFAAQESQAFVNGDAINKPRGFMTYPVVDEANWSWGNVGRLNSGADGGFATGEAADRLIDLVYALKSGYRQNASFMMNRRTQAMARKLKDADGNYIWQPPTAAGARASLMGFPLVEAEDMPDATAGQNAIAFADFKRFYLVVDRQGVRVLRDPYSAKPYVLFYTTKRVGGGVQDFDAGKVLTFSV